MGGGDVPVPCAYMLMQPCMQVYSTHTNTQEQGVYLVYDQHPQKKQGKLKKWSHSSAKGMWGTVNTCCMLSVQQWHSGTTTTKRQVL